MLFLKKMPEDPREKMFYAALSLFTSKGFKETSILEIVEQARVSKTTFYRSFDSKAGLLADLFQQLADETIGEIEKAIHSERTMERKAYAGIYRYIEICTTRKKAARLLLVSCVGVSEDVEEIRRQAHHRLARLIFQTVQTTHSGAVPDEEIRIVSQAMIGAINEVVVQKLMTAEHDLKREQLARLLSGIVIASFKGLSFKQSEAFFTGNEEEVP